MLIKYYFLKKNHMVQKIHLNTSLEKWRNKMEKLISNDLDLRSSDESGNEFDNGSNNDKCNN